MSEEVYTGNDVSGRAKTKLLKSKHIIKKRDTENQK